MKKTIKELKKILDCYFQKLSNSKKCYYCGKKAQASHHIIRRESEVYRWNPKNALPVCYVCHAKIHDENLKEPELNFPRKFIKEYLLENCLSYKDFLLNNLKKICENLNIKTPTIEIIDKKELSDYEKEKRKKYNEYMRKKRKEMYKKKKEYLKKKKLDTLNR